MSASTHNERWEHAGARGKPDVGADEERDQQGDRREGVYGGGLHDCLNHLPKEPEPR